MLQDIALQEDDCWEGSYTEINTRIAEIVPRFEPPKPRPTPANVPDPINDNLPAARENSPNAEAIVVTDGKFDSQPITTSPLDAFETAKRRAANTIDDMREAQAASPNALSALGSVIHLLERELGRSDDAPLLIYEKIMQALRRMAKLCDQGELPAGSIDIEDFRQALNNTALDLMLNDSRVREAVEKRAAFHVSQLSPEEQAHITVLAKGLHNLQRELGHSHVRRQ